MTSLFKKIVNVLEDPEQPLLGKNVKLLKLTGLIVDNIRNEIIFLLIHGLNVLFIMSQYTDLYLNQSEVGKLLQNMKYSITSTLVTSKVAWFLICRKKWTKIINYALQANTERRKTDDSVSQRINESLISYNKFITSFLGYLSLFTGVTIVLQAVVEYYFLSDKSDSGRNKYILFVRCWVPFDTNQLIPYLITFAFQIFATVYAGAYVLSYDANAVAIMIFFRGEFELLRRDAEILFGTEDSPATKEKARDNLSLCHKRHNDLIEHVRLFDSCLSPIMLLYMIVCSVMLCATAYQLTEESSTMQKCITAEYLIFGVSQLFLYCWHSNEVAYVSTNLMNGPYESTWWTRSKSEQMDVKILTYQFNKVIVFSAGPFTNINVATFISIVKGAYSYYTLLSQSQED